MVITASDIKANTTLTVQQLVNQVNILKDELKVPTLYFCARITSSPTDLTSDQDVVFPRVEVNEGRGYDPSTGKFTASIPGMYLFSVQYCVNKVKNVHLEIVLKGKILQRSTFFDKHGLNPCVTMQVSSSVAMGDQVWVRSTGSSSLYADEDEYTSFSGTLIHA
ncbi:complement C1q and tumor necrosis factor-related protein 9A-like [Dreissena polymorpha]|uniref:complement C1q and tumor necrosis factor-related protein 9A-like n=1 Tax=Dreissena polymorpha TaxID=45954 RepID=UPI0022654006|nr:complement C1q and tumor necrosis factor-related protein 9A-like [Dreissena polymorpha]